MNKNDFRCGFVTETLYKAVFADPSPFYEAFEESEEAMNAYWTSLWKTRLWIRWSAGV